MIRFLSAIFLPLPRLSCPAVERVFPGSCWFLSFCQSRNRGNRTLRGTRLCTQGALGRPPEIRRTHRGMPDGSTRLSYAYILILGTGAEISKKKQLLYTRLALIAIRKTAEFLLTCLHITACNTWPEQHRNLYYTFIHTPTSYKHCEDTQPSGQNSPRPCHSKRYRCAVC